MVAILAIKSVIKFIFIMIIVCLVSWTLKSTTWDSKQSLKLWPRNTRDCRNHFPSLHFILIMEMRPVGRKQSLLSKNTVYAFPRRKVLEMEHNNQVTFFFIEKYGRYFISLAIAGISAPCTSHSGCLWGLRDGTSLVLWKVTV